MVCSICHGDETQPPNHNARRCPRLEVGAEQVADSLISGAGEATGVALLTAACPPAGAVVGGVLLAKKAWSMASHWLQANSAKTMAEKKYHMKKIVIDCVAEDD